MLVNKNLYINYLATAHSPDAIAHLADFERLCPETTPRATVTSALYRQKYAHNKAL